MTSYYKDNQTIDGRCHGLNPQSRSQSQPQFYNFNLNHGSSSHQSSEIRSVKSFSTTSSTSSHGHQKTYFNDDIVYSRNDKQLNLKKSTDKKDIYKFHDEKENGKKKVDPKLNETSNSSNKNKNGSTLSLYIAAYEAKIEEDLVKEKEAFKVDNGKIKRTFSLSFDADSQNEDQEITGKPNTNTFGNNEWKNVGKGMLTNGSLNYAFEFPRGDENRETPKPEVMQFKASQKLLNPNGPTPFQRPRPIIKPRTTLQLSSSGSSSGSNSSSSNTKSDPSSNSSSADTIIPTRNEPKKLEKKENQGRVPYTMPGVLHYLQHEWNQIERERTLWEMERAEFQARVNFLQEERKLQENLKRDLIRRIKMLEYSLKQERIKIYRLTHNGEDPAATENDEEALIRTEIVSTAPLDVGSIRDNDEAPIWQRAKSSVQQYLKVGEFGYTAAENLRALVTGNNNSGEINTSDNSSKSNDSDDPMNKSFFDPKDNEDDDEEEGVEPVDTTYKEISDLVEGNDDAEDDDGNDESDDEGESDLDAALEALDQYSFLENEKDETTGKYYHPSSVDEDKNNENENPEAKDETALIVAHLLAAEQQQQSLPPPPIPPRTSYPSITVKVVGDTEKEGADMKDESSLNESDT